MKKVILAFFLSLVVLFGANSAMAQETTTSDYYGVYLEPKIGVDAMIGEYLDHNGVSDNIGSNSNAAIAGGLAVGYDFWYQFDVPVRVEAEYAIRSTTTFKHDDKNVRAIAPQTIFGNAYWDFRNTSPVTPYVGGGAGVSFVGPKTNFAWNAGGGLAYDISDSWKATLGYRFVSYGNIEDHDTTGLLYGHEILAGLRWTF